MNKQSLQTRRRWKQTKIRYDLINRTWVYNSGDNGGDEGIEFT